MPSELIAEASQELPHNSPLFKDAAKSANLLDETSLDTWDSGPSYPMGPPSDNPHKLTLQKIWRRWVAHVYAEGAAAEMVWHPYQNIVQETE